MHLYNVENIKEFLSELLPDIKILLVVKDPIGNSSRNDQQNKKLTTLFFSVRLVSDVVQYNFRMEQRNQKEFMYENINDIVLNKVKTRKFYQKRSKICICS